MDVELIISKLEARMKESAVEGVTHDVNDTDLAACQFFITQGRILGLASAIQIIKEETVNE